jgi:hypothetical protein
MDQLVHWLKNNPEQTVKFKHWKGTPDALHIQVKKYGDSVTLNHLIPYSKLEQANFPEQIIVATLEKLMR